MMNLIRTDYAELDMVCERFEDEAERIRQIHTALDSVVSRLKRGGWQGDAADEFFRSWDYEVGAAVLRAAQALTQGAITTAHIKRLFLEAEEEAGAILKTAMSSEAEIPSITLAAGVTTLPVAQTGGSNASDNSSAAAKTQPQPYEKWSGTAQTNRYNVAYQPGDTDDPVTAAQRSERYQEWDEALEALAPPLNDISFFHAAALVTDLLGRAESDDFLTQLSAFGINSPNETVRWLLDIVGRYLYSGNPGVYDGNISVYEGLVAGDFLTEDGQLISPLTSEPVSSAMEWDIHMVYWEQSRVTDVLNQMFHQTEMADGVPGMNAEEATAYRQVFAGVDALLNGGAMLGGPDGILSETLGDTAFVDWAMEAALANPTELYDVPITDLSFEPAQHRRALGIALIFQNHYGTGEAAHQAYLDYMAATWNSDTPAPLPESLGGS